MYRTVKGTAESCGAGEGSSTKPAPIGKDRRAARMNGKEAPNER